MITPEQKERITKVLGFRYASPIKEELKRMGIVNANGKEHTSNMITQVMNGVGHDDIERAIFAAVKRKHDEIVEREKLLKQL